MTGCVVKADPVTLPAALVRKFNSLALPKVGVMLWVAVVKEPEVKVRVYSVPAVPPMPTLVKVATPATALTVKVPTLKTNPSPPLEVMVTEAVLLVTVLPKASLIVMTGWVVNDEPLALPAAEVLSVIWVAF